MDAHMVRELIRECLFELNIEFRDLAKMSVDLSKLQADVAAQGTVIDSVNTLLAGLAKQIADLKAAAPNDTATQAAIDALATQVEASTAKLTSAVTANTTSAGPAPISTPNAPVPPTA